MGGVGQITEGGGVNQTLVILYPKRPSFQVLLHIIKRLSFIGWRKKSGEGTRGGGSVYGKKIV